MYLNKYFTSCGPETGPTLLPMNSCEWDELPWDCNWIPVYVCKAFVLLWGQKT